MFACGVKYFRVFCTASNLDSSLKYINYVLSSLGYPSPIALQNPTEGDVVATVNTLYALLEHRQVCSYDVFLVRIQFVHNSLLCCSVILSHEKRLQISFVDCSMTRTNSNPSR